MTKVDIVGDIGGTTARLAISGPTGLDSIRVYSCAAFPLGPSHLITQYLKDVGIAHAERGVFAVAGNSADPTRIVFTNGPWKQNEVDITRVEIKSVKAMNDFAAVGYSVAEVRKEDCTIITGGGEPFLPSLLLAEAKSLQKNTTQLLLSDPAKRFVTVGPGTGLGVSGGLVTENGQFLILGGEGGHAAFAPNTPEEMQLMEYLESTDKIVTMETIASGTGLALTFNAFCYIREINASIKTAAELPSQLDAGKPKAVRDAAHATLKLFAETLGRCASSAALTMDARTVFIAGGVIPKLKEHFYTNTFTRAFQDNDLGTNNTLRNVPVVLITHPQPGLLGCHAFLRLQG